MKTRNSTFALFVAAAVLIAAIAIPAAAQILAARADIPFAFEVNGKTMPAGMYTVSAGSNRALTITDNNGHFAITFSQPTESRHDVEQPKLVFHRTGSRYDLTELYFSSGRSGYQLPAPKHAGDMVEVALTR